MALLVVVALVSWSAAPPLCAQTNAFNVLF
jgi:hypothetical protein